MIYLEQGYAMDEKSAVSSTAICKVAICLVSLNCQTCKSWTLTMPSIFINASCAVKNNIKKTKKTSKGYHKPSPFPNFLALLALRCSYNASQVAHFPSKSYSSQINVNGENPRKDTMSAKTILRMGSA